MRWGAGETLIVNEVGEYQFLDDGQFQLFGAHGLAPNDPDYRSLKAKHFLTDSESAVPIQLLATKYRTKKDYLEGFTKLHLFVVTLRCDHTCKYCQVSRALESETRFDMSPDTADRALALTFQSPSQSLKIEFQGGEPLLNFDIIRRVVTRAEDRSREEGRSVQFVIASNLALLTDEMLAFMAKHDVHLSTSLDGPASVHDANRPRRGGGSHANLERNLARARAVLGADRVNAVMTTTELSLRHPREIIDEYVRLGFLSIFLRPISPYGFAVRTGEARKYAVHQFADFYRTGLRHIIELNLAGVVLVEVYAQILLRKMLTPFATGYVDLQSPSGAGIGAVAYNYDGDVYASDEARMLAEMGDHAFRLGNVHRDSYEDIFGSSHLQRIVASSCIEALPGCSECAYLPYCGGDPVFHWATQRDPVGHRPTSAFCAKQMFLFRHLFELLRGDDAFARDLLIGWANNRARPIRPETEASA
jgi:His-Xaa-Ser system radical SAM maturase HxsB